MAVICVVFDVHFVSLLCDGIFKLRAVLIVVIIFKLHAVFIVVILLYPYFMYGKSQNLVVVPRHRLLLHFEVFFCILPHRLSSAHMCLSAFLSTCRG